MLSVLALILGAGAEEQQNISLQNGTVENISPSAQNGSAANNTNEGTEAATDGTGMNTPSPAPAEGETAAPADENGSAPSSSNLSSIGLSVVATPEQGVAPLRVQFTAVAAGQAPISYVWDLNNDGTADSVIQSPSFTYQNAGNYTAAVTATDASGLSSTEQITIIITSYDSQLALDSYFPTEFNKGVAQITFIVANEGTETLTNIAARMVGNGVEYLTSTTLPSLRPGDKDTLTVKVNILKTGVIEATAKVLDKNFPVTLNVTQQVEYNAPELQLQLAGLKQQLDEQEKVYFGKKSEGYLVNELGEQVQDLKGQLLDAEQQILTGKLADASVSLHLTESALTDLSNDLQNSTRPKQTPLMWLKDNAVAIAAIIAALGTIGGLLVKVKHQAGKAAEQAGKLGKEIARKKWFGKKGEVQVTDQEPSLPAPPSGEEEKEK